MPAKHVKRIDRGDGYFHIFNKGVSGKFIFKDESDYGVFLSYLKDYLNPPAHTDSFKRNFTVKGRIFRGVPHQIKNYFNKVDLLAYNLMPTHFHLLLHQTTRSFIEKFMRSLCTRYSMYFNKKYQSGGLLFEGPYKSAYINSISPLLHLTRYFHRNHKANDTRLTNRYSSYEEYLDKRETLWVKSNFVLSYFNNSENITFRGIDGYKNFVEKYEPDQRDKNLLANIILEKESEDLLGGNPQITNVSVPEESYLSQHSEPGSRFLEFAVATAVFVLLFTLGLRNVYVSSAKEIVSINIVSSPSPTPVVAGIKDEKPKIFLTVKINDESSSVNIRQNPTIYSEKIGSANNGDVFEFISTDSGWYKVKLTDETFGFISSKYIEVTEDKNI